jgi:hypothetical protein
MMARTPGEPVAVKKGGFLVGNVSSKETSTARGGARPGSAELLAQRNLFLFNEKNRAFLEGQTWRIKGPAYEGNILYGVVALLCFALVGVPLFVGFDGLSYFLLQISHRTTEALVTDARTGTRVSERGHRTETYYLTYRFTVRGEEYSNEDEVDESVHDRFKPGSRVKVIYFPGDPRISNIATLSLTDSVFLTGIFLVGIAAGILTGLYRLYRRYRLSKYGQLLCGKVTAWDVAEKKAFASRRITWKNSVTYQFTTPAGQVVDATKRFSLSKSSWPTGQRGDPLAVIFVNEKLYDVL